jgi:hypothetical protein
VNDRESAVRRAIDEAVERVAGVAWSELDPCRCWTEPARVHTGHCCMAEAGATCHEEEGVAAHTKQQGKL